MLLRVRLRRTTGCAMCRYVAYSGEPIRLADVLYNSTNSLIHQASEAMESRTRVNADGFGIGWYNVELNPKPAVFKDVSPAWSNANLRSLADKIASSCVFAHIRATRRFDPVSRANCHPFHRGHFLWMHNGDVPNRARLHRRVVELADDELVARIRGNTDTELAFTLFLTLLGRPFDRIRTADELAAAMTQTIGQIVAWWREDGDERPISLNFCVTDGRKIVAARFARNDQEVPSLHFCTGSRYVCVDGVCRVLDEGGDRRCVLIASEQLSDDSHWSTVPDDTLAIVREDLHIELRPLQLS